MSLQPAVFGVLIHRFSGHPENAFVIATTYTLEGSKFPQAGS